MVKSNSRGHEIYFDGTDWLYKDNQKIISNDRPCKKCGRVPTKEGYDACLGHMKGATSACCGHGIDEPYIK